ncbi:asialoglycoprotein receptor 2-like [Saccostrea echinata]|uniref:asialoglycoprotein receptor 2-like n=1 Tax=Saccostrea echinata TaxID=191078 RepID=UPI002A83592D|nr:asialoglycoprotein receptor 2-like [Saccostrea echinata]
MQTKWLTIFIISGLITIVNTKRACIFNSTACEKGWVQFERSCYQFLNKAVILKEAVNYCNRVGAHLLEIKSSQEEKWVDLQLKIRGFQYVWIGLTDILKENDFVFISTGGKPTFSNWGKNEPNNAGKTEHCVEKLAGSRWNDRSCDVKFPFVCERNSE